MVCPVTRRSPSIPAREWLSQPVVQVGLGLVALHLGFRVWAMSTTWFYTDDYSLIRVARESSFSWSYLMLPENGHVMPATRALYYLLAHDQLLNWDLAVVASLTLQLVAALSALWMLVVLFGPRWEVLALLVVYLTSAMTAQATLWWISSINQTPVLITFFLATGAWVLYLRSGRWPPLVGLLAALVWGLLFFQKSLFVLPTLALIALFYFASGNPWQRTRGLLRRFWPALVAVVALAGSFTAYYAVRVPSPAASDRPVASFDLVTALVLRALPAGVTGGPVEWETKQGGAWADPPPWFLVLAWVLILGLVGGSMVLRRRAGRAWVLLLAHYLLLVVTLALSRAAVFGAEIGNAYRLQTEGLCVAVLALGLAWLPLRGAVESSELRPGARVPSPRRTTAALVLVTTVVGATGIVSWVRYAEDWRTVNDSKDFVLTLNRGAERLPGIDVVDRELPESILTDLSRPNNRLSDLSTVLARGVQFPTESARLAVITDDGRFHQALVDPIARSTPGPVPDCGWLVRSGEQVTVPMTAGAPFEALWMRIPYYTAEDAEITITVAGRTVTVPVRSGPNNLYVRIIDAVDGVRFDDLSSEGALCVDRIELGPPVPGPRL